MDKNSIYMQSLSESLTNFGEVINKSFSYLYDTEFLSESLKIVADDLKELSCITTKIITNSIDYNLISNTLSGLSKISEDIPETNLSFLTTDIEIGENEVLLSDKAMDELKTFFQNYDIVPKKQIKSKSSLEKFFYNALIPIICVLLQFLYSDIKDMINSSETEQYHSEIIEIFAETNENISHLTQTLENYFESQEQFSTVEVGLEELRETLLMIQKYEVVAPESEYNRSVSVDTVPEKVDNSYNPNKN